MEDQQVDTLPKRRERRDALQNRERLIAVAKDLFATHGVADTNMQDIARAAGVGQGTLYRHFAHKSELCHALIDEDLAAFRARVGALIARDGATTTPLQRLEIVLSEKNWLTESHLPLFATMDDSASGGKRPKPFRGPFHTWLHEQISLLLEEAVEIGAINALDVAFTADAILAACAPPLYSYQRNDLGYSVERIIAGMGRIFIDGLRRGSGDV